MRLRRAPRLAAVLCCLALAACGGGGSGPYVAFTGGGFLFNYRIAEASYGFVARVLRPIPAGTIIEAEFEDPAGGPPIVMRRRAVGMQITISFQSPAVKGVEAGRSYRAVLRLIEPETGRVLDSQERMILSEADQKLLPARPPVVGPGYQPAPEP